MAVLTNQDLDLIVAKNLQVGLTRSSSDGGNGCRSTTGARAQGKQDHRKLAADWESRDTGRFLNHYSKRFRPATRFDEFAAQKKQVNASKEWIKLKVDNLSVFRNPGKDEVVVVTFEQDYRSNNLENR